MNINTDQKSETQTKRNFNINFVIFIAIIIVFTIIYFLNSKHLWHLVTDEQDIIFASDTKDTLYHLQNPSFEDDARKHLLLFVTLNPISRFLQLIFHLSPIRSIRLILAFFGALNIGGTFLLLRNFTKSTVNALFFSGLYAFAFSTVVIYSIPETYSSSNLFVLLYLAVLLFLRKKLNFRNSIILTMIAAAASLFNPVLLSLLGIHLIILFFQTDKKRWVIITLLNLFIGSITYILVNFSIYKSDFFTFVGYYSSKYASLHNFQSSDKIFSVISDFYFYSILSPHSCLTPGLDLSDWHSYFNFPVKLIFICLFVIFLLYSIFISFKYATETNHYSLSIFIWMIILTAFYVYFNPYEAMLYSSQIILPITILVSQPFDQLKIKPLYKYSMLGIFLVFIAYTNYLTYYTGMG